MLYARLNLPSSSIAIYVFSRASVFASTLPPSDANLLSCALALSLSSAPHAGATAATEAMTDSIALDNVRKDLGDDAAKQFEEAVSLARKNENNADELNKATAKFCDILTAISPEKTKSCGYAEVLLEYGRALLFFLRKTAADNNPLLGGNVEAELPKGKQATAADAASSTQQKPEATPAANAAEGATTGDAGKEDVVDKETAAEDAGKEGETDAGKEGETETGKEEATGDGEDEEDDDVDTEELTWEQLEHARLTFENLGAVARPRLADVFETLGDLLLESDQSEGAAAEYAKAVGILLEAEHPKLRIVSQLHYSRYLALRRDAPQSAVAALEESVGVFEKVAAAEDKNEGDEDVLKEMREELRVFKNALGPALATVQAGSAVAGRNANGASSAAVTVVKPKRRIAPMAVVTDDDAEASEPATKKARVSEEADQKTGEDELTDVKKDAVVAEQVAKEGTEAAVAGQGADAGAKAESESAVATEDGGKGSEKGEEDGNNCEKIAVEKGKAGHVVAEAVPDTKVDVSQGEAHTSVGDGSVVSVPPAV